MPMETCGIQLLNFSEGCMWPRLAMSALACLPGPMCIEGRHYVAIATGKLYRRILAKMGVYVLCLARAKMGVYV